MLGGVRVDTASYDWTSEKNAIGYTGTTKSGPTDVVMADPGFVRASKTPCDLNSCYRNDLHIKADSAAGLVGAGVPEIVVTPPPVDPPPVDPPPVDPPPVDPGPTANEYIDKAIACFKATTITYQSWLNKVNANKYPDVTKTQWWQGFDNLEKAKSA